MTVNEYKALLSRNGLSYRVSGDKVIINSKRVPPVVAKATREMKPQLIAAANPILNARHNLDAHGASESGARDLHAAKEDWNTRTNDWVLGKLHGVEKAGGITGLGADVAEFLYPQSKTGKVLEGLPLAAGALAGSGVEAGALGLGAMGAGVGALTGAATGEGALGGAAQGALFGAGDIWANAAPLASKLWKGLFRDKQIRQLYNKQLNATVANIIGANTKFGKAVTGGQNWAKLINSQTVQSEMSQRLESARDAIRNEMESQLDSEKNSLETGLRNDISSVGPSGMLAKQVIDATQKVKDTLKSRQGLIDQYDESLSELRRLGKKAYPKGLSGDTSAADAAKESMAKLDGNVSSILTKFNPELLKWYKGADDAYAKFKALGNLASKDIWTEGRGMVDPQKLQTEWLKAPKYYQQRLGDSWGVMHDTIGRHSDLMKEGQETDIPGALQRARALMHGGGRLSVFAPIAEMIHGPRLPQYAGTAEAKAARKASQPMDEAQKLLANRFKGQPSTPARPITRGALFSGVLNPGAEALRGNENPDASNQ